MAIINRVAKGFLGLLDAKTQGRTPQDTEGALSSVIDIKENYLADIPLSTAVASQAAPPVLNFTAQLTVPEGVIWYVYGISCEVTQVIATQWSQPAVGIAGPDTIVPTIFYNSAFASTVGIGGVIGLANIGASMDFFSSPFLATPGTRFGAFIFDEGTAPGGSAFTRALYREVVT